MIRFMNILSGVQWETSFILQFQQSPSWLQYIMEIFTFMGYPQAYMLVIAVIYWAFDRKLGMRMAVFLPFCAVTNSLLKQAFHAPRPYWTDIRITGMHADSGFGMPSGHAQSSTVWILGAVYLRKVWFWIIAIIVTLMVGVSRSYLGVHFPSQILAGWITGLLILMVFIRLEGRVLSWIGRTSLSQQIWVLLLSSAGMILLGLLLVMLLKIWEMPEAWILNTQKYLSLSKAGLQSYGMASVSGNTGSFLGVALGAVLMNVRGNFNIGGTWTRKLLRVVIGIIILGSLFTGIQFFEPGNDRMLQYSVWRFAGFFIISFSAVFILPLLFRRIGLMGTG